MTTLDRRPAPVLPPAFAAVAALLLAAGCSAARPSTETLRVADPATPPSFTGLAAIAAGPDAADALLVGYPELPSLSPDGSTIVFSFAGDLWAVPSTGGDAVRLTAHPADERRSAFSPDGSLLAFESDRDGAQNLYVMPLIREGGKLLPGPARRVTVNDRPQGLSGFSADGKQLLFSATLEPSVHRMPRMHAVDITTGQPGPVTRLTDAFGRSPRQSSDGARTLFSRGGSWANRPKYRGSANADVFELSSDGAFRHLAPSPANDYSPFPLPDGSTLFISSRDGQNNLWLLPKGAQEPRQITRFAPTADQLTIAHGVRDLAVSHDGSTAVFAVWDRLYRLDLKTPDAQPTALTVRAAADSASTDTIRLSADREITEAALSPDGKTMAFVARGEVFVRPVAEGFPTRRVTATAGRERELAWSPDGSRLYFVSDDWTLAGLSPDNAAGIKTIYAATVALAREDLAPKDDAKADDAKDEAKTEEAKPEEPKADEPKAEEPKTDEAKPDADKPADGAKKDKKPKKPDPGKRWQEALRFTIAPIVPLSATDATRPVPSPDGLQLLYIKGRGDLVHRDLVSGAERTLLANWDEPEAHWLPDSRHIVYAVQDLDYNSDIWLLDTAAPGAGEPARAAINLTRHPDLDLSPRLSADGKILTFLSDRAGDNFEYDVYQINLDKALDDQTAYQRDEYFKKAAEAAGKRKPIDTPALGSTPEDIKAREDAAKAAEKRPKPKPLVFDADDAYLRVRRLTTTPGSEGNLALAPGGERIVFTAQLDGEPSLVSIDFKGADRKTIQAGAVGAVNFALTGDRVSFLRQGQAFTAPKGGGKVDAVPLDAPLVIDAAQQQRQKFLEAARIIGEGFYHPTLKGLDWNGLTRRYLALAEKTRSTDGFNSVVEAFFGELDGSHLGISGGTQFSAPPVNTGALGVRTVPAPGGYRVVHVTRETPAAEKASAINVGEVILAIDAVPLAPAADAMPTLDLDAALAGKAGKEVLVDVRSADAASPTTRTVLIIPISTGAYDARRYQDEVLDRRALVDKLSGGRLGYLHIRGMSEPSVRDFERDLFAAAQGKDGLLIDVRDNGGGSTADILLSSLTAPRHAWTAPRGVDLKSVPQDAYPRDRRLIYAWTRPLSVLINQNSFSNAEIFAHAVKTISRGKLVGVATAGGVISTGAASLIDGATVRTPFRGWYLPDGTDMENNGAQPDLPVQQTPESEVSGTDPQLEAAVQELLNRAARR